MATETSIEGVELQEELGRGAHSVVYRGTRGDGAYAVKIQRLRSEDEASNPDERFAREAAALVRLDHPSLPTVWSTGRLEDGRKYLVMELFEGRSLDRVLASQSLSTADILRIGLGVANGLSALHGAGFVHRDINPNNVIWDGQRAKLVDFGLVTGTVADKLDADNRASVAGTIPYASPEQLNALKRSVTPRSDLYSLGALLFVCCTGRPPFEFDDTEQLIEMQATETPPSVRELAPEQPPELAEIVDRLLRKDPDDRYSSARETTRDLFRGLSELSNDAEPEFHDTRRSEGRSLRAPRLAGRRDEEARLTAAWFGVRQSGRGRVAAVRGSAGMGKSALVDIFTNYVRNEAAAILEADCSQQSQYSLETLRTLVRSAVEDSTASADDPLEQALEAISASDAVREFVASDTTSAAHDRTRNVRLGAKKFVGEIVRLLVQLVRTVEPAVLVVEAYERADRPLRYAIERFCSRLATTSVLVVLTLDDDHPDAQRNFETIESQVDEVAPPNEPVQSGALGERCIEISLEPLDPDAIAAFSKIYLARGFEDRELLEYLESASRGNPFLLRQLVDALLDKEVLRPDWDDWNIDRERLAETELSSDVRELLVARIGELDDEVVQICRAASVWGIAFPLAPVAAVVDLPVDRCRHLAEVAVRADVLEIPADEENDYQFLHGSIRRALEQNLSDGERASFHQQFAEWLDERAEMSPRIADHYLNGDGSTPRRLYEVTLEAGRQAAGNYDFDRTRTYLERATLLSEDLSTSLPAEAWFLLGWAYAENEDLDRAKPFLERAKRQADDPEEETLYELKLIDISASRFELAAVERGATRCLERLDEPVPRSAAGKLARMIPWFVGNYFRESPAGAVPKSGSSSRRQSMKVESYVQLSIVAVFDERPWLILYANVARTRAAQKMGLSAELSIDYSSRAVVRALMGHTDRARDYLDRAREIADRVDNSFARSRAALGVSWVEDIDGHPVRAAKLAEETMRNRGDQIAFFPRSLAIETLCHNYSLRGKARRVLYWYRQWRTMHGAGFGEMPPGPIYSNVLPAARMCGEEELAEQLLEGSRASAEGASTRYLSKAHRTGVLADRIASQASDEALEEAIEQRLELDPDPDGDVFWAKSVFIYLGYARRRLLRRADPDERLSRKRDFADAIDRLRRAAGDHPTHRSHAAVLSAEWHYRDGDREEAYGQLGRAEIIAREIDNEWVLLEVEQLRADWCAKRGEREDATTYARHAVDRAHRIGWTPLARRMIDRFELDSETESSNYSSSRVSTDLAPGQIEARRKLDALLEVSKATSSILDPDAVSRVVVESALRVLGAGRGFLFLTDDPPVRDASELQIEVVARNEPEESNPSDRYSQTVLQRVVEAREPIVVRGTEQGAELGAESIVAHELRSIIAAPLYTDNGLVGAIYLDNRLATGVFDERDVGVLRAIANHIPIALETARAAQLEVDVTTEREKRRYAERLRAFTNDVNELLDVPDILGRLLEELGDVLSFDSGWGGRIDDGTYVPIWRVTDGEVRRAPEPSSSGETVGAYLENVLEQGSAHLILEVTDEDRRREPCIADTARAWLALPLLSGAGETVGAVALSSRDPNSFDTAPLELAKTMADQAGLAIEKTLLATVDPLTGRHNRRKLFELADREFARARRQSLPLSTLLLDIDDFKEINDRHGHSVGDRVLERVATVCADALRESDIFGRYGGEEFAGVLPATPRDEAVEFVAARLRRAVAETDFETGAGPIEVTVSVGVAGLRDSDGDIRQVLERADEAMYRAKQAGKNCVAVAPPSRAVEELSG